MRVMLTGMLFLAASQSANAFPKGDINLDGMVSLSDLVLLRRAASGEIAVTTTQRDRGDVAPRHPVDDGNSGNGALTPADLNLMLRALSGENIDGDGLDASAEQQLGTSLFEADTDRDGLSDDEEVIFGTNPAKYDTDGDGVSDWLEIQHGLDPNDPLSNNNPPIPGIVSVTSIQATTLGGTGGACIDDGLPSSCGQEVRVVTGTQPCNATPVRTATLGASGGAWTISGLSVDSNYTVYLRANDGAATACSSGVAVRTDENDPPSASSLEGPYLSGSDGVNSQFLRGGMTACSDPDGIGNPNGTCSRSVRAVLEDDYQEMGLAAACLGAPTQGSSPVGVSAANRWEVNGLARHTRYVLYPITTDGDKVTCGVPLIVSSGGVFIRSAEYEVPLQDPSSPSSWAYGVQSTWRVKQMFADDWSTGGHASQVMWMGIDRRPLSEKWVEIGVTHGWVGTNAGYFYTTWGDRTSGSTEYQAARILAGSEMPTVDQTREFVLTSCRINYGNYYQSGPRQSFSEGCGIGALEPGQPQWYAACLSLSNPFRCFTWRRRDASDPENGQTAGSGIAPHGTYFYSLGVESTSASSRVDRTIIGSTQIRFGLTFEYLDQVPVVSAPPPQPSGIGLQFCPNPNHKKFRYWLNPLGGDACP